MVIDILRAKPVEAVLPNPWYQADCQHDIFLKKDYIRYIGLGNSLWSVFALPWAFRRRVPACNNFGNHPPWLADLGSWMADARLTGGKMLLRVWRLKNRNNNLLIINLIFCFEGSAYLYIFIPYVRAIFWVSDERVGPPWVFQKMEIPFFLLMANCHKKFHKLSQELERVSTCFWLAIIFKIISDVPQCPGTDWACPPSPLRQCRRRTPQ